MSLKLGCLRNPVLAAKGNFLLLIFSSVYLKTCCQATKLWFNGLMETSTASINPKENLMILFSLAPIAQKNVIVFFFAFVYQFL